MDSDSQDRISMLLVKFSKTFPIRVMEWLLAGILLSWSIVAWNLTDSDWSSAIYIGLSRIAAHETWAFFAFWIAVVRIGALTVNGAVRSTPHLRAACAFVACFMWLQISLGLLISDGRSMGIAIYPWLLLADIYNVFRASHDARLSDDRARARRVGARKSANAAAH